MPGIRGYADDAFAFLGGTLSRKGRAEKALGVGASGMFAARRRENLVRYGKSVTRHGVAYGSLAGMASQSGSRDSYRPAPRPMTSTPPGLGRSA